MKGNQSNSSQNNPFREAVLRDIVIWRRKGRKLRKKPQTKSKTKPNQ